MLKKRVMLATAGILLGVTILGIGCKKTEYQSEEKKPIEINKVKEEFDKMKSAKNNAEKSNEEYMKKIDSLETELIEMRKEMGKEKQYSDSIKAKLDKFSDYGRLKEEINEYSRLFDLMKVSENSLIEIMPIYDYMIEDEMRIKRQWVSLIKSNTIESKLEVILTKLKEEKFEGLNIKLIHIKNVAGKKIAVIDLIDDGENKWESRFNGSTGGMMISNILKYTTLQPDYMGEWIDGIEFSHNGKELIFDHTDLYGIIYRKDLYNEVSFNVKEYVGEEGVEYNYTGGFENAGYSIEVKEIKDGEVFVLEKGTGTNLAKKYTVRNGELRLVLSNEGDNPAWEGENNRNNIILKEPLMLGNSWISDDSYYKSVSEITALLKYCVVNGTTYSEVIEVTTCNENGYIYKKYFAKGVGLIKYDNEFRPSKIK